MATAAPAGRVIAVLCILLLLMLVLWLGLQMQVVHEREQFMSDNRNVLIHDPFVTSTGDIPWIWTALGASKYSNCIRLPRDRFTQADLVQIESLFPECKIELAPDIGRGSR
jgi:hypothetical protein